MPHIFTTLYNKISRWKVRDYMLHEYKYINFRRDLVLLYYLNSKGRKTTTYFLWIKLINQETKSGHYVYYTHQISYSCFITLMMKISFNLIIIMLSLRVYTYHPSIPYTQNIAMMLKYNLDGGNVDSIRVEMLYSYCINMVWRAKLLYYKISFPSSLDNKTAKWRMPMKILSTMEW